MLIMADYNGDGLGIPDHDGDNINSLKEYSNWDPTKYYNVWLVMKLVMQIVIVEVLILQGMHIMHQSKPWGWFCCSYLFLFR